jgi:hypothetical protein
MDILKRLDEIIAREKVIRYPNKHNLSFVLTKIEAKEIFGDDFMENSLFNEDYEDPYQMLYFEDNNSIYCIHYEFASQGIYRFLSFIPFGSREYIFYYEPDDHSLKQMKQDIEYANKKIQIYSKVLQHPKHRLKGLFE